MVKHVHVGMHTAGKRKEGTYLFQSGNLQNKITKRSIAMLEIPPGHNFSNNCYRLLQNYLLSVV